MQAASGTWVGRSCASHLPGVCASVCVSGAFEEEGEAQEEEEEEEDGGARFETAAFSRKKEARPWWGQCQSLGLVPTFF